MIAVDTNVLIYSLGSQDSEPRSARALETFIRLEPVGGIIPLPVIGEFLNVSRRKSLVTTGVALAYVERWLEFYTCPAPTAPDYVAAIKAADRFQMQFFDALILTIARRAGATVLLSEDMHDGLIVGSTKILNPFESGNEAEIEEAFEAIA